MANYCNSFSLQFYKLNNRPLEKYQNSNLPLSHIESDFSFSHFIQFISAAVTIYTFSFEFRFYNSSLYQTSPTALFPNFLFAKHTLQRALTCCHSCSNKVDIVIIIVIPNVTRFIFTWKTVLLNGLLVSRGNKTQTIVRSVNNFHTVVNYNVFSLIISTLFLKLLMVCSKSALDEIEIPSRNKRHT